MNDAPPSEATAREITAAQFVLGTLDRREANRVAAAIPADPAWRQAMEDWTTRLLPLWRLTKPEPPPPDAWDRIEARVVPQRSPRQRRAFRIEWLWRLWAISASAAAISSVLFVLQMRLQQGAAHIGAVLVTDRNAPALVAEIDNKTGSLRLASYAAPSGRNLQAPSERDLQIWVLPSGSQAPVSLGLMPHEPGLITIVPSPKAKLTSGTLVEISLEPVGGSPLGHPTGPVVFFGRLGPEAPAQQG